MLKDLQHWNDIAVLASSSKEHFNSEAGVAGSEGLAPPSRENCGAGIRMAAFGSH